MAPDPDQENQSRKNNLLCVGDMVEMDQWFNHRIFDEEKADETEI